MGDICVWFYQFGSKTTAGVVTVENILDYTLKKTNNNKNQQANTHMSTIYVTKVARARAPTRITL